MKILRINVWRFRYDAVRGKWQEYLTKDASGLFTGYMCFWEDLSSYDLPFLDRNTLLRPAMPTETNDNRNSLLRAF